MIISVGRAVSLYKFVKPEVTDSIPTNLGIYGSFFLHASSNLTVHSAECACKCISGLND